MTLYEKSLLLADVVGVVTFVVALLLLLRWRPEISSPGRFFLIWAAVWLFEYYFLGANSYIHMDDEGDHFIPYYLNLIDHHLGGQFGHRFAGGNDVYTGLSPSIQLVSPELVWLTYLPVWVAVLLHKAIVVSVGFWGGYLLCRKTVKAEVFTSIALAALFTVSTENIISITYSIGSSLTFLPMAIWVLVGRSEERRYWRYAIPFAIVVALYLDPTHVVEAMFTGLGLAAIMLRKINLRVILSLAFLLVAELINWGEPLYGMYLMSPLTERGGTADLGPISVNRLEIAFQSLITRSAEDRSIYLAFGSLLILWLNRDRMAGRWTVGVAGVFITYAFMILFPFQMIGLGVLSTISHQYLLLAVTALMLLPLARAAEAPFWNKVKWRNAGSGLILALAIGMLASFKVSVFSNLLYHGGQNQYHGIGTLAATDWRPKQPFRVITLRVRDLGPEPAIAYGLYGLESFDVFQMLQSKERSAYYHAGILKQPSVSGGYDPRLLVDWSRWRNGLYRGIGEQVSLNLLRVANVGFIISPIPFEEDGVELVVGPDHPPLTKFDRKSGLTAYLADRIDRLTDFPDMYIYSIPRPYPQLYAADRIVYVSDTLPDIDFIKRVDAGTSGPGRVLVARRKTSDSLGQADGRLIVESFRQVKDGYAARVSAPNGGILVVNTPALPFWHAVADGRPLQVSPVNEIQLAVQVPPGAREVLFQYARPSLKDGIKGIFR